VNYKNTAVDSIYLNPKDDNDDLVGFFVQDTIEISDKLSLIAGIKFEDNSFTGGDWSPRGCILYTPWNNHHFRFSISRSYRTPSYFENSSRVVKTLSPSLPIPIALLWGNEHMDPEEMTAFELGYRTTLFKRIGLNVEFYYNEIDDLIERVTLNRTIPLLISYDNAFNAIAKGIEFSADLPVTSWWRVTANYTFQQMEYTRINKDVPGTPKHKFNIGSSFTFRNGFSLDVIAHFVDETKWGGLIEDIKIDDYVRLDLRISQKLFNDKLEISFVGQNLTDKLHPETSDGMATYEVEQLLYGQITWRFQ